MAEVIPVIHNVSSVQRVVDMARLAYSLDYDVLVVTKAYGGAAQSGVPEAMRLALREGKSLITLPDLEDAVGLLNPDKTLLVTRDYQARPIDPLDPPGVEGRVLIVFPGGEPDFTASEARLGEPVYPLGVPRGRMGAVAEAAVILYGYRRRSAEP